MGNKSGSAYGLTALIPVKQGSKNNESYDKLIRDQLEMWPLDDASPMSKVPNTYICRMFLLNDCFYVGAPAIEEHLENRYLVFSSNFYGELDSYLHGMWDNTQEELKELMQHCLCFDEVSSPSTFADYIKRCQVDVSFFFNGSTDKPLEEQLKGLYLKQAFSYFCYLTQPFQSQGDLGARRLQNAYQKFNEHCQPNNLGGPTWPIAATRIPENLESEIKAIVDSAMEEIQ
ncbi:MAG: hypothetical protein GKR96_08315 [Gammaproteobacteria bacterium]|nr:hypothetical protein [Gammaproteobacteria bacterium]